jgi:DNA (cytosine-5)-methyltransferase 1
LLLAGFPCQSFSIAGMQKGFEDIRGTLFFDVARILLEKKPKYVLLENVKNLISHDKGLTIKTILKKLNQIGYTIDFTVINSSEAGVPQNRDRTYICGILESPTEKFDKDSRSSKVNELKQEFNKTEFRGFNFFNKVKFDNDATFIENILEKNVPDSYFLNTKSIADFITASEIEDVDVRQKKIIKLFDIPRDVHNDLERQRRVYSVKGISPTVLARADSTKIFVTTECGKRIRKITPVENFYIQGFEQSFVDNIKATGMSATQMYKQSGNAVSPPVITGILNYLYEEFISND